MSSIAVYPGSFDPVTLGHLDIAARAAKLFAELHIVVVHNPAKTASLPSAVRIELIREGLREAGVRANNIKIDTLDGGLLVDYCTMVGARALIKGFRSNADLDYELPMAQVNRDLADVESIFLPANPQYGYVSSSLVKQVFSLGGDVSGYVTKSVERALASSSANRK